MAAANLFEYPCFSIAGINIEPIADVSATAEPERPAKRIDERIFTWASPPLK